LISASFSWEKAPTLCLVLYHRAASIACCRGMSGSVAMYGLSIPSSSSISRLSQRIVGLRWVMFVRRAPIQC
jgi:hypothetical protein